MSVNKSYVCPSCKKKQNAVLESVTASVIYEIDLNTEDEREYDTILGERESFVCPNCHQDLDSKIIEKLKLYD